ncbi:MAG: hypothetical protein ACMUHY_02515 [Thermoplasmatota archaeon]
MKKYAIALIMALLISIVVISPAVSADEDALHVVLICREGPYSTGENARLEVHVFEGETHVEADQPPMTALMVQERYDEYIYREQRTERMSEGVYATDFEIFDSDGMTNSIGHIGLIDDIEVKEGRYSQVTRGWDGLEDTKYDFIESQGSRGLSIGLTDPLGPDEGLKVSYELISMDQYPWEPEDTVEFDVEVRDDGQLVKPDDFYIYADLDFPDISDEYLLPYNNPEDGKYTSGIKIPSRIDRPGAIEVTMYAEYLGREARTELTLPVNKYQIWMRNTGGNDTMMSFDLHVSDMYGQVVAGQEVGVLHHNDTGYNQAYQVTDATGRIGITVHEHTSDSLDIMIWVDDGAFNQTVDTYIPHRIIRDEEEPEAPSPWGYGFEVIPLDYGIDPLSDTERAFWAFTNGEPLNTSTVYYYVYSDKEMISTGKAVTNTEGKFFASFSTPILEAERITFDFQGEVGYHPGIYEGYDWEDSDGDGYSDNFEKREGTDPTDYRDRPVMAEHSDWDGFTDEFEIMLGTDPEDPFDHPVGYVDSDMDGFGDAYEESEGTDPDDISDFPTDMPDADGDGYPDDFENANGTDPQSRWDHPDDFPDTDGDGICDGMELFYGTDPEDQDDLPVDSYRVNTDEDYLERPYGGNDEQYDLEEVFYEKDPQDPYDFPYDQYSKDSDGDDYCDEEEHFYGTNPDDDEDMPRNIYAIDEDYDGVCDEEEYFYGSNPDDYYDAPNREPSPWDPRYDDHNSTDGKRYLTDMVDMHLTGTGILDSECDNEICMRIDDFSVGSLNDIRFRGIDGIAQCYGIFFPGSKEDVEAMISGETEPQWTCLDDSNIIPFYCSGDEMMGFFAPPSFLPVISQEYVIIGSQEGGLNYMVVRHGESASVGSRPSGGGGDGFPMLIVYIGAPVLLLVIIIIVVLALVIGRSKKGRERKKAERKAEQDTTAKPPEQAPGKPPGQQVPTTPPPVHTTPPAVTQEQVQAPVRETASQQAGTGFFADQPQPPVPPAPQQRTSTTVQKPEAQAQPVRQMEPPQRESIPLQQEPPLPEPEPARPDIEKKRPLPPPAGKPEAEKEDKFGLDDIFNS